MSRDAQAPTPKREVFHLAWPLILSNISVPLLGMVDTAVVGHLPAPHHLGAVALGAATFAVAYLVFASVRMGTTALTAQAVGAGDGAEARACLVRPLVLALLVGALLILLSPLVAWLAIGGFGPTGAVAGELATYIAWRIAGAPAALAQFVLLGWLIGNHDTKSQLVILVFTNVLNAALSVLFVLGFGWGVMGVALGTAIAEWCGLVLGLALVARRWRLLPGRFDAAVLRSRAPFVRLFRVNGDLIVRTLFLEATFLGFAAFSARQGEILLAANAVLNNLLMLQAYALDGFAFAAEALVARAFGAGRLDRLRRGAALTSLWGLGAAGVLSLAFGLGGGAIIDLMTTAEAVREAARTYLPWMVAAPLLGLAPWMLDGIFIGATRARDMRNMMLLSVAIYAAAVAVLAPTHEVHGLWAAVLVSFLARGATLGARYPALERAALSSSAR